MASIIIISKMFTLGNIKKMIHLSNVILSEFHIMAYVRGEFAQIKA